METKIGNLFGFFSRKFESQKILGKIKFQAAASFAKIPVINISHSKRHICPLRKHVTKVEVVGKLKWF